MKTSVAEKLLPYSEVCRMGQAMFAPDCGTNSNGIVPGKRSQKGNETGQGGTGKVQGVAVFFHPACVLRGSPPEGVHKPLSEDSVTLLSTTTEASGCCQSRQNTEGTECK